ncbi:MAG: YitT family protein [Clostridia bacterium]|nr:YitT family protein [Clostridia bacterium]
MKVIKKKIFVFIFDQLCYLAGCILYAIAVTSFFAANKISPGGITGIATALNYAFSLPTGAVLLILNIPILALGFWKFGGAFIVKTAFVTMLLSIILEITEGYLPTFNGDKILSSLFGGVLAGAGLSLIILHGATTGGIDILAKFINRKFRHFSVGRLILLMDSIVIILAMVVYENIESGLYSVLAMYVSSYIMDTVLYGADKGKIVFIITEKYNEIAKEVNVRLGRGVTMIPAKGSYTGENRTMLMCTLRRYEVSAIYSIINEFDTSAFVVVGEAGEIIGEGFKSRKGV